MSSRYRQLYRGHRRQGQAISGLRRRQDRQAARMREIARSPSIITRSETVVKLVSGEDTTMLNARAYGAEGDGVADDTNALKAWLDDQVETGRAGYLPAGTYRVTSSLNYRDTTASLSIHGDGARQTFLYGDFIGAGQGILDLSDVNRNSGFHRVSGVAFIGNGVPGDPVGMMLEHAWSCVVEDVSAPNINGKVLANSLLFVTKDNNSKFRNIHSQSGFQPKAFDIANSARVSFTNGSQTITADTSIFTAAMVGHPIYFNSGSDTGSHLTWKATVSGFTSGTQITIDTPAPSSASDAKAAVGRVGGTISAGSNQLVLDQVVGVSQAWVGMQVHIMGAALKPRAGNKAGLLSTRIAAVSGNTLTLAANATVSVTNNVVLFAPPLFVGDLEEDPSTLRTNHSWWSDVHCEGFSPCGIIVNSAIYVVMDRLKLHGAAFPYASDWGQCFYGGVFSDIESLAIRDIQANYGVLGEKFHISASSGVMEMHNVLLGHLRKDRPGVLVESVEASFRLQVGDIHVNDLVGFAAAYELLQGPAGQAHIVSNGVVHYTSMIGNLGKAGPAPVHMGATAQHQRITVAAAGVFAWKPPGKFGVLHIVAETTGVVAVVHYRTSDSNLGAYCAKIAAGTEVDTLTTATTLTGATGTAGRVTVAADASGRLQIENRRGFGIAVALYHTPFAT